MADIDCDISTKSVSFNNNNGCHSRGDEASPDNSPSRPEPLFNPDSAQNKAVKDTMFGRNSKKPKRMHSNSFSHSGPNGYSHLAMAELDQLVPSLSKGVHISTGKVPFGKNSKKSRNGLKGLPKKGGAGGKGVWGKPGSELDNLELDENDPDYDSDAYTNVRLEKIEPVMNQKEFDDKVTLWVNEYFEHGDPNEILVNLDELTGVSAHRTRVPYLCVSLAVQRKPVQCELTSELLSQLAGHVMSGEDMQKGFHLLLSELPDLTLDSPDAPDVVGRFIARAVADDVLPPKFIQSYKGRLDCPIAVKALAKSENLLTMAHAYARLDTVWGVRSGVKATKMLVRKIRLLLQEFICSNDQDEAMRCLRELEAPHFHHELVYQAILLAIEKSTEDVSDRVVRLLAYFCQSVIVTVDQLDQGLRRIYADMPDIQLDVPSAYFLLDRLVTKAHDAKFVTEKQVKDMPNKGRKRFVSEGDGGLLKGRSMLH